MDLPMANFVSLAPHGEKVIESFAKLKPYLAGGFKDFWFSPLTLQKIPSLTNTFQGGWFNHQPVIDLKPCFLTLSIQICQICPKISGICLQKSYDLGMWCFGNDHDFPSPKKRFWKAGLGWSVFQLRKKTRKILLLSHWTTGCLRFKRDPYCFFLKQSQYNWVGFHPQHIP